MEKYAGRPFPHRADLAYLIAASRGRERAFEEAIFLAKFITRAGAILRRPAGEDITRLSAEYAEKLARASAILRDLSGPEGGDEARAFADAYLASTHESLGRLLALLEELARIKNYLLDRKWNPPPS